jgi:hypothetical protein
MTTFAPVRLVTGAPNVTRICATAGKDACPASGTW